MIRFTKWIISKTKQSIKWIDSQSLNKQEFINFLVSLAFALSIGVMLIYGTTADGTFKNNLVTWWVNFFSSPLTVWASFFYFIPAALFLFLKAAIFQTEKYLRFNLIAQLISGFFYSFGLAALTIASYATYRGYAFEPSVIIMAFGCIFIGYWLYVIFQAAIQRQIPPKLN